jgi:hypothetical protein
MWLYLGGVLSPFEPSQLRSIPFVEWGSENMIYQVLNEKGIVKSGHLTGNHMQLYFRLELPRCSSDWSFELTRMKGQPKQPDKLGPETRTMAVKTTKIVDNNMGVQKQQTLARRDFCQAQTCSYPLLCKSERRFSKRN